MPIQLSDMSLGGQDEVDSCTIYDLQDSEFDEENVAVCVEL